MDEVRYQEHLRLGRVRNVNFTHESRPMKTTYIMLCKQEWIDKVGPGSEWALWQRDCFDDSHVAENAARH